MKTVFTVAAILLSASCANAQSTRHPAVDNSGGMASYSGAGWGSGGAWTGSSSPAGRPVVFEPPRQYTVAAGKNDGPFVPSVYMSYEDALALGRQMLAEEEAQARGEGAYSLGEAARIARMSKTPTFRLKARVTQDNAGKMQICNLNGNDCHKL